MSDFLITADASKVSPGDFFRRVRGLPPMSEAEKAERAARAARIRLIETIERAEFLRARREREAMIRDRIVNGLLEGESHEQYLDRTNRPFAEARKRIDAQIAEFDRKAAA